MVHYKDLDQYLRAITHRLSRNSSDNPPSDLFTLSPSQVGYARSVSVMPYDFDHLVLSQSANERSSISVQYSAASHGLRVQLLLQPLTQSLNYDSVDPVAATFYLAHLACKVNSAGQSWRVGIVLISQERGSYQRPSPVELVVIDGPISNPSGLMLEDIYITVPQPRIASLGANDGFQSAEFVFPTRIRLIDEQFQDSGFAMIDFAPSSRQMRTEPSGYIVSTSFEFNIVLGSTVIVFDHPSTAETFAVDFYLFSATIKVGRESSSALDLWKSIRAKGRSGYTTVNDLRKGILLTRLPGGRTLFISIKNDTHQRSSFNILVKGHYRS
jgi:hypothetical protein